MPQRRLLSVTETLVPIGTDVPAFLPCDRTRPALPRLTRFVFVAPSLQPAARSSAEAERFVLPLSLGTVHICDVTLTRTVTRLFAGLGSAEVVVRPMGTV